MWGWHPVFPEGTALAGSSHGSAYPESETPRRANRDINFSSLDRAVRAAPRVHVRREWIVRAGCAPATTPMWISRAGWLDEPTGCAACARKVREDLFLRVDAALAAHAGHGTGRHCAVTGAVVVMAAGCWPRTVVAAW